MIKEKNNGEKMLDLSTCNYKASYMEMKLHADGEDTLVLRIPTFWDATEEQWIGAIQTPITKIIISATGKDSFELQNNFNIVLKEKLDNSKISTEVFSMFKKEK